MRRRGARRLPELSFLLRPRFRNCGTGNWIGSWLGLERILMAESNARAGCTNAHGLYPTPGKGVDDGENVDSEGGTMPLFRAYMCICICSCSLTWAMSC